MTGYSTDRPYRRVADHQVTAAAARQAPGTWTFVGTYEQRDVAHSTALMIRNGRLRAYAPAGAFQVWRTLGEDRRGLWVRYVDGLTPSPDVPEAMSDAVRCVAVFATEQSRYVSAAEAATHLAGEGFVHDAARVTRFIGTRGGRKSALQAAAYLYQCDTAGQTAGGTK